MIPPARLIRWAGLALLALSLLYLALEMRGHWEEVSAWRPAPSALAALGGLAVTYAAMLYLLAEVWHRAVGVFGAEPRRRTWRSYALTQIARYLPGNVAHLLGRALVLRDGPLTDAQLGLATLLELALVPAGAVLALAAGFVFAPDGMPPVTGLGGATPSAGSILTLLGLGLSAMTAATVWAARKGVALQRLAVGVATALPLSTAFMLGLGASFGAIVTLVGDGPFLAAAMAGILAWLIGYAVPGAPGGLGPREAALVLLLSDAMLPGELLIAAALLRVVTVLGDVLCFAAGALLLRNGRASGGS